MMDERIKPPAVLRERLADAIRRSGLSKSRVRRPRRRRPHDAVAAAVRRPTNACPGLDTLLSIAAAHDAVARLARRALQRRPGRGGDCCSTRSFEQPGPTPTDELLLGWFDRGGRLQDPLCPGDAARPDEVRRGDPLRALRGGGPAGGADDRTTAARLAWARHPDTEMECCSSVQASPILRPRRGYLEPARRRRPAAPSSTG